jgi:hypothetical protein
LRIAPIYVLILSPIFDGLYLLFLVAVCVMQLPILNLTINQKLVVSYLAVALCVLLSCLLALHNLILNIAELLKFFCKIDCFGR